MTEKEKRKHDSSFSKVSRKISKTEAHKPNILLSIITLSIYHYFGSQSRLLKLKARQEYFSSLLDALAQKRSSLENNIDALHLKNDEARKEYRDLSSKTENFIKQLRLECDTRKNEISALPISCITTEEYLMGHASLEMTQNVYTDAQGHYIESVSDRVRGLFDTK